MKKHTALRVILILASSSAVRALPIEMGPQIRFLIPSSRSPMRVESPADFDGAFLMDGAQVACGAEVQLDLAGWLSLSASGLFCSYSPYIRDVPPDSVHLVFLEGSLAVAELGLRKEFAGFVLEGGSEIHAYREKWMVSYDGGFAHHRSATRTDVSPYAGLGVASSLFGVTLETDARLLFPRLDEIWISAGMTVLLD